MAGSVRELVCVALPKYCSLFGVGRLELLGDSLGEALGGTIQRPVLVYFLIMSSRHPLYHTSTPMPNFVNLTLHLASHSLTIDIRGHLASPGMV